MNARTMQRILAGRSGSAEWTRLDRLYDEGQRSFALRAALRLMRSGYRNSSFISWIAVDLTETADGKTHRKYSLSLNRKAWRLGLSQAARNAGIDCRNEGRYKTAELWFRRALRSNDPYVRLDLAKLYLASGKNNDAHKLLVEFVEAGPQIYADLIDGKWEPGDDPWFEEGRALLESLKKEHTI